MPLFLAVFSIFMFAHYHCYKVEYSITKYKHIYDTKPFTKMISEYGIPKL